MSDLYKKIEDLCIENSINITKMCKESGASRGVLTDLKSGRIKLLSLPTLQKIAAYFGVTVDSLIGNTEIAPSQLDSAVFDIKGIEPVQTKRIPLLGEIACGEPTYANEDRESYIMAGTDVKADFCLKAKGDSMINARIMDGDIVFVHAQPVVNDGEIAAVIIGDDATLKRVYYDKQANILQLVAENPAYRPIVYTGADLEQVKILGKAVAFQSDIV